MTPLQAQKYSELQRQYGKSLNLNTSGKMNAKDKEKVENYNRKVQEIKELTSNYTEVILCKRVRAFFYKY